MLWHSSEKDFQSASGLHCWSLKGDQLNESLLNGHEKEKGSILKEILAAINFKVEKLN